MASETCVCRAKVVDSCLDGKLTYPDGMADDSTYRNGTVVCDSCYLAVEPLMRMNMPDIPGEVDQAVQTFRRNMAHLREVDDPSKLVREAEEAAAGAQPGSPFHVSANYMASLARREVERREGEA